MKEVGELVCVETGETVCAHTELADTFLTRLQGLQFRKQLARDHGLLIVPSHSIHTACMRFSIDAVFLDADGRIVDIRASISPWSIAACGKAKAVLELAAGCSERVEIGQLIRCKVNSARKSMTFLNPVDAAE